MHDLLKIMRTSLLLAQYAYDRTNTYTVDFLKTSCGNVNIPSHAGTTRIVTEAKNQCRHTNSRQLTTGISHAALKAAELPLGEVAVRAVLHRHARSRRVDVRARGAARERHVRSGLGGVGRPHDGLAGEFRVLVDQGVPQAQALEGACARNAVEY